MLFIKEVGMEQQDEQKEKLQQEGDSEKPGALLQVCRQQLKL